MFTTWRKASFSDDNGCVELARSGLGFPSRKAIPAKPLFGVRDSKLGAVSPVLVFPAVSFRTFLHTIGT